ncbi:hypothetical protein GFPCMMHI_01419 [Ensifer adhaerens]|nr:hypothetical protein [Ensifer adhaerens]
MPRRSSKPWLDLETHDSPSVAFRLKHKAGSAEETRFLKDALVLKEISSFRNFEQLRQTSPKNDFTFGFSMEFDSQSGYDAYNIDPDHVAFVRDRWVPEVESFLEIDYTNL